MSLRNFGDCHGIGEGVQELRIDFGPGYRVYFGQEGATIVLLLGLLKKAASGVLAIFPCSRTRCTLRA